MPSSGYTAISFTAGEQPTTAKWNLVGSNDASFNTGNGFNDAIIVARHESANHINQSHIDWTTTTPGGIWWQELGRVTLGTAGTSISLTGLTARKYLQIRWVLIPSGSINPMIQFNGDTSTNYSARLSANGAADITPTSQAQNFLDVAGSQNALMYGNMDILNFQGQEKMSVSESTTNNGSGAANAPTRREQVQKWANTAAQITSILVSSGGANFAVGSEVTVIGHD